MVILHISQIKRLRQLEKEKEMLIQGLEIVDQARDWYQKQVQAIDEKQKYVGKATYNVRLAVSKYLCH